MSCAHADFVHVTDSSQSTRCPRATGSAAPIPRESPALFPPALRSRFSNLVSKGAQLSSVEHCCIHHAYQNFLDGAVAEPVDDALDGFCRYSSAGLRGLVDIGSSVYSVCG